MRTTALSTLVATIGLAASSIACTVHTAPEPYATTVVTSAPVDYESYPSTEYEGRPVYLVDDRWYYQDGPTWVYYRDEPEPLRHYRASHPERRPHPERREEGRDRPEQGAVRVQAPNAAPPAHPEARPEERREVPGAVRIQAPSAPPPAHVESRVEPRVEERPAEHMAPAPPGAVHIQAPNAAPVAKPTAPMPPRPAPPAPRARPAAPPPH